MTLFHPSDPAVGSLRESHFWSYVYLDGRAEEVSGAEMNAAGIADRDADDLIVSDVPRPELPGEYPATLYGQAAIVVMAERHGHMGGRVALAGDLDSLAMCRDTARWG